MQGPRAHAQDRGVAVVETRETGTLRTRSWAWALAWMQRRH